MPFNAAARIADPVSPAPWDSPPEPADSQFAPPHGVESSWRSELQDRLGWNPTAAVLLTALLCAVVLVGVSILLRDPASRTSPVGDERLVVQTQPKAPSEVGAEMQPEIQEETQGEGLPGGQSGSQMVPAARSLAVAVTGEVRNPGLVFVPAGGRVADAIAAAGGVTAQADLASINLASPVSDADHVHVRAHGEAAAPGVADGGSAGAGDGAAPDSVPDFVPLDLNSATQEQLEELPGIGPVLAERILQWRSSHGPFLSVQQLRNVSGIGPKVFAALESRVRV